MSASMPGARSCCSEIITEREEKASVAIATNERRSPPPRTCPSASGGRCSRTRAWSPRSWTGSPSTPTSCRPVPNPTGYGPARKPLPTKGKPRRRPEIAASQAGPERTGRPTAGPPGPSSPELMEPTEVPRSCRGNFPRVTGPCRRSRSPPNTPPAPRPPGRPAARPPESWAITDGDFPGPARASRRALIGDLACACSTTLPTSCRRPGVGVGGRGRYDDARLRWADPAPDPANQPHEGGPPVLTFSRIPFVDKGFPPLSSRAGLRPLTRRLIVHTGPGRRRRPASPAPSHANNTEGLQHTAADLPRHVTGRVETAVQPPATATHAPGAGRAWACRTPARRQQRLTGLAAHGHRAPPTRSAAPPGRPRESPLLTRGFLC